ncbi:ArsR/SmtB family transcription factor [Fodinicola acaciae]|uniref:ArsR/SmtB family transcription factor n=1 Tax=Fodinicola acaciae TaxID=2681555 RepID=UPI0013D64B2D|nr:helix-turn-helix domain-containing protein [Fodinicola acaciae]
MAEQALSAREPDIAATASAIGDQSRTKVLSALASGRALPASVLASEAGVSAATVSGHLAKLLEAGLITVERHGRHRYYRLSGPEVAHVLEALARISPPLPVRSLRAGTRANALRRARTCYDHIAGRLGVALMTSMLTEGVLAGHDGTYVAGLDRLSSAGQSVDYRVTGHGRDWLADLGVVVDRIPRRRPLVRYCVDWSEQRHHLAGALGAALADRLFELDWLRRAPSPRVVLVTDAGRAGLSDSFGIDVS